MEHIITMEQIREFEAYLRREERAENTVDKYMCELYRFFAWVGGRPVEKNVVTEWKEKLMDAGKAAVTVNAALAALHSYFAFAGWEECRVKYLKIQRRVFRNSSKELTKEEYQKLIDCAVDKGNTKIAILMEAICATGIRVSEVKYITVEAVKCGYAEIFLKGKIRMILIPGKLAKKLLKYARSEKISSGEIFLTARRKGMSRRQIWGEMKQAAEEAGISKSKVFPHNLRHLFARTFYKKFRDVVRLADVLGHSSIETTRIYLMTTCTEYARELDGLGLVL